MSVIASRAHCLLPARLSLPPLAGFCTTKCKLIEIWEANLVLPLSYSIAQNKRQIAIIDTTASDHEHSIPVVQHFAHTSP